MDNDSRQPPDRDAVMLRRKQAGIDTPANSGADLRGLALSGGGIRSATFCFGLLRGLARGKSLKQFDYLSTVSGGGYIGSAFGRLFDPKQDAQRVQDRLGETDTLLLWWLRNNGRYLTPSGARDLMQALASILRNTLFSLLEAGLLVLLGAGLMLLPYAAMALLHLDPGGPAAGAPNWPIHAQATFGSAWMFALLLPVVFGSHSIFAYWYARDSLVSARAVIVASFVIAACACGFAYAVAASIVGGSPFGVWHAAYATIAAILFTPLSALAATPRSLDSAGAAAARLAHTKRLGYCLWAFFALAAVAAVDWVSAGAAAWVVDKITARGAGSTGISLLAIVALARIWLPRLQAWLKSSPVRHMRLEAVVNIAGLVLLGVFVLVWVTAFQLWVHPQLPWRWFPDAIMFNPSLVHWAVIVGGSAVFCAFTAPDVESLNLSSLHNFYRARLERAYVSTGNWARGVGPARFPVPPLDPVRGDVTRQVARLVEAVARDDIPLRQYKPHEFGGPIHLLTCCVNQTVDDRTGLYNADRKGIALTVSALGVETGTRDPVPFADLIEGAPADMDDQIDRKVGRLSRWVAISGAAAGSGMGSQTTPGLAALLFLCGVRLGFWTDNLLAAKERNDESQPEPGFLTRRFPKQTFLLAELLARFPGLGGPNWYVSDGGHFENTAVYPLLKRRLGFILVADCGADPKYGFEDLESLVRKAKIDYGAGIEFILPSELAAAGIAPAFVARCGSLADISDQDGTQAVLVARVRYDAESTGVLVVVKPRRLVDAPMEVTGYARHNPVFPQESTANQFFSESQWEAYHQLGLFTGAWFEQAQIEALLVALKPVRKAPEAAAPVH